MWIITDDDARSNRFELEKKFLNGTHAEENNYFVKEKRFKPQYNSRMKITLCPGKILHIFVPSSEQKKFYDTLLQRDHTC